LNLGFLQINKEIIAKKNLELQLQALLQGILHVGFWAIPANYTLTTFYVEQLKNFILEFVSVINSQTS